MDYVQISTADGLIVQFPALVTGVGASDRCDVHSLADQLPVEDRIPSGCRGLDKITSFYRFSRRRGSRDGVSQLCRHRLAEFAAMRLIRTVDFDLFKAELTAEKLQVSAGLPSGPKQPQDLRLVSSQILRRDSAQGCNPNLLNNPIVHNCNWFDFLDIEQDYEAAVAIARGHRQYSPALHARRVGKSRHVGSDPQCPNTTLGAAPFLRLEPIPETGMVARLKRHVGLTAGTIDCLAIG